MSEDEAWVFIACAVAAVASFFFGSSNGLHPLCFNNNPWPGLVRLSFFGAMGFVAWVLWRFADPSVTGIYNVFYMVMAWACVVWGSRVLGENLGARFRVDVCEHRNPAAASFQVGLVLGVGLLFGSSLWGEADPLSDDEGGWWIPLGFFAMGMAVFFGALKAYAKREDLRRQLISHRNNAAGRAAATYALGLGWALSRAVAGDFYGWMNGIVAVGQVAAMLLAHALFRKLAKEGSRGNRAVESAAYLVLGFGLPYAFSFVPGWGGP